MWKLQGRILICLTAVLLIFQFTSVKCLVTESAEDTELTTGEIATLQDDACDEKGIKTIYRLSDYTDNEVLVVYVDGTVELISCESRDALAEQLLILENNDEVEVYQPNFSYSADAVLTVSSDSTDLPEFYGAPDEKNKMVSQIEKRASVNIAEAHPVFPADPYYYLQWALNNNGSFTGVSDNTVSRADIDINAPEAWKRYKAKRSAIIALIDTGVEYFNPEIQNNMWVNEDEAPGNGIDDDGNGYVDDIRGWNFYRNNNEMYSGEEDDHGTHCASSILAASNKTAICGIAGYSNIRLMNIKALGGNEGEGTTLSIMKAIQYAEQNGASICNLSLGTDVNDYLLYRTMKQSEMLFVTAAGNSANPLEKGKDIDVKPCYPASYSLTNILSVANINAEGQIHETSDYGKNSVDLAAPGSDILGVISNEKMVFMTGTSMAAPMVTAAAAMVYTNSYSLSLKDTAEVLRATVKVIPGLSEFTFTGGMLDLGAAIAWK